MTIRSLPDAVISQIAAGEVVERPASVVKELVENALDAGASAIDVETEGAGKRLVRVADNGAGIPAAEVELAFARHATSKLRHADDLFRVTTLGFRGEALASIASVGRVTLRTRQPDDKAGVQLVVEGGAPQSRMAAGAPPGTQVTVEDLFYTLPARLKFLKSDLTEKRQVTTLVTRYALAYPSVQFRLVHDGREAFRSSGNGDVREVLAGVMGTDVARQMIGIGAWAEPRVGPSASTLQVSGFVSPPALTRADRREITIFVNGRWVQDARVAAAVLQAYRTLLMVGRYPWAVIRVDLATDQVDVNVHPAKAEVRFSEPDAVFRAVQRSVRAALLETERMQALALPNAQGLPDWPAHRPSWLGGNGGQDAAGDWATWYVRPDATSSPMAAGATTPLPTSALPLLRCIGQVATAYLVAEGPDGLYLVDQHAAHERVLYEAWMADWSQGAVTAQALLAPTPVELSPQAGEALEAQLPLLKALGLDVEAFGGHTYLVRSLPTLLAHLEPGAALRAVVESSGEDEAPLAAQAEARLIARVCKRAAVKAGQVLAPAEQQALLRQLEACRSPRTCPHGRPTMVHLSLHTLERQFGRKG